MTQDPLSVPLVPAGWGAGAMSVTPQMVMPQQPAAHGVALVMMPAGPGRDALVGALGTAGFSVLAFDSPLEVARHLYGVRPQVVLVDAAHGAFMASQAVSWQRLTGLQSVVVVMGNSTPGFVDQMTRAGVNHCVAYPTDVNVFAGQVVTAVRAQANLTPSPVLLR